MSTCTKLEYIESTGTQYINTGIYPTSTNFKAEIQYQCTRTTAPGSNQEAWAFAIWNGNSGWRCGCSGPSLNNTGVGFTFDNTLSTNKTIATSSACTATSGSYQVVLCGQGESGSPAWVSNSLFKIYYCKIWNGNELVRNLVPCKYNNQIGLWDISNGVFLGNSGTGDFIAGPEQGDVTIRYTKLEYIQSSGNQYIDSLLTMEKSDSVVMEISAKLTNNESFGGVNGYLQYQANIGSGNKGIIKVDYDGTSYIEKIYFEDTLKSTSNWSSFSSSNNKIGIIGMGQGNNSWWTNSSRSAQSGQWYYVKIYKNNELVRDFIPVKTMDCVICLYDLISKTFYVNSGSGSFIAGPEISEIKLLKINGFVQPKINGKKVFVFNNTQTHYNFDFNSFYTLIDYIEGTGTQWIDTGIQPTTSTKIATKCSFSVDGGNVFIGATGLPDNNDFRIFRASGAYLYFDRGSSRLQNSLSLNTVYELEFGNWYMKINGQTVQSGNAFNISLSSSTIKVMPTTNADYGKIYYLKIYDGDTLIRDFIPVIRNSDNEIGLYDKTTKQFFTNQGTGTFIGG